MCDRRDSHCLVGWEEQEIARSVAYPVSPVVNANVLAALVSIAAVPVCSF
jgi:hypothetical protein